jgi:hypothetical protein
MCATHKMSHFETIEVHQLHLTILRNSKQVLPTHKLDLLHAAVKTHGKEGLSTIQALVFIHADFFQVDFSVSSPVCDTVNLV